MFPRTFSLLAAASLFLTQHAQAVVLAGGDGTQNTTAPVDDFGWANVGRVYDTVDGIFISGVYLGNGWMLSAYHGVRNASSTGFQFGTVFLNGGAYSVNAGTAVRLQNADTTLTDLALFQLTTTPAGLTAPLLASEDPTDGLSLSMMGNGPVRNASETHWNVNTVPATWTWTETGGAGNAQGYKWTPGQQSLRWGTNNITAFTSGGTTEVINYGLGDVTLFKTTFNNTTNEAQAGGGDSGGGVFWKEGEDWVLGGIMLTVGTYNGQPSGTSVYGDATYAANLKTYSSQITSIIPEPSSAVLVLAGVGLLARRRRI